MMAGGSLSTAVPGVLDGDYDPEGDSFTAVLLAGPANGTLTLNPDGSFVYTPNAGFRGTDSISLRSLGWIGIERGHARQDQCSSRDHCFSSITACDSH